MSAGNFRNSLSLVLAHEGGYVNHPKDPGGATNKGITQKVYDAYRTYMRLGMQSVKLIKDSEVSDIYNKNYWKPIKGDSLPCGLDYAVFDFGVNSGVSRAVKYLQRQLGLNQDGVLGLVTLSAVDVAMEKDEEQVIAQYCANRLAFLKSLSTFDTFGKGWTRRVVGYRIGVQSDDMGVLDYATLMARRDNQYLMPREIGKLEGEVAGKAIAPDTPESYIEAPKLIGSLAQINDQLAAIIAAG
jgi:lysozyme family protein